MNSQGMKETYGVKTRSGVENPVDAAHFLVFGRQMTEGESGSTQTVSCAYQEQSTTVLGFFLHAPALLTPSENPPCS